MIDGAALAEALTALGLEAEVDLGGVRVWVSAWGLLWQVVTIPGPLLLLGPPRGVGLLVAGLSSLGSVLIAASLVGLPLLAVLVMGGGLLERMSVPLRRRLGQRLVLSPQALSTRWQSTPLEEIGPIAVEQGRLLSRLVMVRQDGRRVVLVRSDRPELLRVLLALILQQRQVRLQRLAAEGHDLSKTATAPALLHDLRRAGG